MSQKVTSGIAPGPQTFEAITPGVSQTVAVGATSEQSTGFQSTTTIVRLTATSDCFVVFGADPTADDTGVFLPKGGVEYFGVTGGQMLAVLQASASGVLYVTEGA